MRNRTKPRLDGKICIVTGAGMNKDIIVTGMTTAVFLAREGSKFLVADVCKENATNAAQQIRAKYFKQLIT
tara:strand:+ start:1085 stop:1297 length:213 start_codon:yes stop_codon:yes gene_type:complete